MRTVKALFVTLLFLIIPFWAMADVRNAKDLSGSATTDLDARANMSDGDAGYVYYISGTQTYHLDYVWDNDSTATESLPWIVDADAAGNGRWLLAAEHYKTLTFGWESPSTSEKLPPVRFEKAAKIYKVIAVVSGSGTPSVTFNIQHNLDYSNTTTGDVFSADKATTSTTTGDSWSGTDLDGDVTIAANEWLWPTTSATGGTVTGVSITVIFTYYWGS